MNGKSSKSHLPSKITGTGSLKRRFLIPVLTTIISMFIALLVVSCGGGGGGGGGGDTTAPTVDLLWSNGSPLWSTDVIEINFSESMDTGSLILGGNFSSEGDGGAWTTVVNSDDQLTIRPSTSWSVGMGRTLIVDAQDLAGNPMETLSLIYDVLSGVVYFVNSSSGADTNNGLSVNNSKRTIMGAVNIAAQDSISAVWVAGGNYIVDSASTVATNIVMKRGVSLYGGYSSDFTDRDTTLYVSSIVDQGTSIAAVGGNQNRAILVDLNPFGGDTVIDGFSITGGAPPGGTATGIQIIQGKIIIRNNVIDGGTGALNSVGIYSVFANPTIEGNIIHGGTATDTTKGAWIVFGSSTITGNNISGGSGSNESYGIHVESTSGTIIEDNDVDGGTGVSAVGIASSDSSPVIVRNTITGGDAIEATGIFASGGTPMIRNNNIDGGSGVSYTIGISLDATSPEILNNTVNGGAAGSTSVGLNSWNSSPAVENNILFTSGGTVRFCFREGNATSDPTSMDNNDLFDCSTALYQDEGSSDINSVTVINNFSDITPSGNVSVDPVFVSVADRHLTGSSPAIVTQGGLDISGTFTTDRDGTTRTAPWSIGAYEQD